MNFILLFIALFLFSCTSSQPEAGLGIMVGDVSEKRAFIQVRISKKGSFTGADGEVEFSLKPLNNASKIFTKKYVHH